MEDHDSRLKKLIQEFVEWFFQLVLLQKATEYDLSSKEWLQQEIFSDPPSGTRRRLDLVVRLRHARRSAELLANIEIESEDSLTRVRKQLNEHYHMLRNKHGREVLSVGLYLRVGLQGRGLDSYTESTDGLTTSTLSFSYLGLPKLDAAIAVQSENLLEVSLSGLMRQSETDRPTLKAKAMQRIAVATLTERQRYLLMECVEAYSPLHGPHLEEFERLLLTPTYREAFMLAKTSFEKGIEKGREEGLDQGREEGEAIGQIHTYQKLMKQPITPKVELLRRSLEELTQLAEALERQLLSQSNGTSAHP